MLIPVLERCILLSTGPKTKVSIGGTGFASRGIQRLLACHPSLTPHRVLTRRSLDDRDIVGSRELLTNSIAECLDGADIFIECSGDPVHAAESLVACAERNIPAATMNPEAQITVVSALLAQGAYITDCLGDQPGCLAQLHNECVDIGLEPLCYVNLKGFVDKDPSPEAMRYWADKQGLSLEQTTSFTDGTKLQIEQALVANGLGAQISKRGMEGPQVEDLANLDNLARLALKRGCALSDWALNPGGPPGVLILAKSDEMALHPDYTPYARLKTKEGTAFRILRPHHLIHVEAMLTLNDIANGKPPLINNGLHPSTTVVAIAKCDLPAGTVIKNGLGSFKVRGEAWTMKDAGLEFVPITLLSGATLKHSVARGEPLAFSDVDIPATTALRLYRAQFENLRSKAS